MLTETTPIWHAMSMQKSCAVHVTRQGCSGAVFMFKYTDYFPIFISTRSPTNISSPSSVSWMWRSWPCRWPECPWQYGRWSYEGVAPSPPWRTCTRLWWVLPQNPLGFELGFMVGFAAVVILVMRTILMVFYFSRNSASRDWKNLVVVVDQLMIM